MQAMIFAAGLGTRLKPLTDRMPKAMVEVAGKPLLLHVLDKLSCSGFRHIVINVHHFSSQITDYLDVHDDFGLDIAVSDESDRLLDTGGGLKKAVPLLKADEPVLIHNVDILSNVDLADFYLHHAHHDATLLVSERKTNRYLLFDDGMRLVGWTNTATGEVRTPYPQLDVKSCRCYAFSGIHVMSPRLLSLMTGYPDKFGIIDFYLQECAGADIHGYVKNDLRLLDVGKLDTLAEADCFVHEQESKIQRPRK